MEKQNEEYDDEINLHDLWKVIAKRKMLIIGLFVVVVGLTAIYGFMMPNIYRGEAVLLVNLFNIVELDKLKSEIINAKEITDSIGSIDKGKRLKMVPKSYSNVKNIKLDSMRNSKDKIRVTIDAKKIDDIPRALSEVVGYLNNMDIIKTTVSREKEKLIMKSTELSDLKKSSPDLLATYRKLFDAGKLNTIGFNPVDVGKRIIDIKAELLEIDQKILRLNNGGIEIAVQPYISNKPVSPKILQNVILSGIISLFVGIFFALFIEYIGNVKNRNSKAFRKSSME